MKKLCILPICILIAHVIFYTCKEKEEIQKSATFITKQQPKHEPGIRKFIVDTFGVVTNKAGVSLRADKTSTSQELHVIPQYAFFQMIYCYPMPNNESWCEVEYGDNHGFVNRNDFEDTTFYAEKASMPEVFLDEYYIGTECDGHTNSEWEGILKINSKNKSVVYKQLDWGLNAENCTASYNHPGFTLQMTIIYEGTFILKKDYLEITFNSKSINRKPNKVCTNLKESTKIHKINKTYKFYPVKCHAYGKEYGPNFYAPEFSEVLPGGVPSVVRFTFGKKLKY